MSLRLAARLARREVRRRRGRTALVALLVALPVCAMATAVTLQRTLDTGPDAEWQQLFGDFDAVVQGRSDPAGLPLPEGSTTLVVREGYRRLRVGPGEHLFTEATDLPLDDARLADAVQLVEGRPPRRDGEVVLSPELADALRVRVGDRLDLERPRFRSRVVGLAEQPECLDCHRIVVAPGAALPPDRPQQLGNDDADVLMDLPQAVAPAAIARLEAEPGVSTRAAWASGFGDTDDAQQLAWTFVLGGLVLAVMAIVIAAAFAVGARRQLATLGQLSANGAPPRTLATTLVLQGTFTGLVGAAIGMALAWAALLGGHRYVEVAVNHRIDRYAVAPWPLAGAVAAGVLAATAAALVPAHAAAGLPTLQAMAGRRPLPPIRRRLPVAGMVAVAIGLGLLAIAIVGARGESSRALWGALAIAGGVIELIGACAAAPVLVARLEPLAGRLRGTGRLAARSLARQRTRSGAVVSAVCAAGALAAGGAALVRSAEVQTARDPVVPDRVALAFDSSADPLPVGAGQVVWTPRSLPPDAARAVQDAVPGSAQVPVRVAVGPWQVSRAGAAPERSSSLDQGVAVVADDAVLDAFEIGGDAREELAERGVVVLHREAGAVTVRLDRGRTWSTRSVPSPHGPTELSTVLVTPLTARDAGVDVRSGATAFRSPRPLTDDQRAALADLVYDGGYRTTSLDWSSPRTGPSPLELQLLLSGGALLFSVFVVGATLALAAAESRDERDTLVLAGAPPRALARAAGAKAGLLSGLGGLLALPIGLLPVAVFCLVDEGGLPFRVPWPALAVLVVAVPVLAAGVAWATSGAAQRLRPARFSTMAFD